MSRRGILGRAGAVAAASASPGVVVGLPPEGIANVARVAAVGEPLAGRPRAEQAYAIRVAAARNERALPLPDHPTNGDETRYGTSYAGSFSKGLPHNALGEVDPSAYALFLKALASGRAADFDAIPLGGTARLGNPLAAYAYVLEGPDPQRLYTDPAPQFAGAQAAAEMAEIYWQALARDVQFARHGTDPVIGQAAADLSRFPAFRATTSSSAVTPATLFPSYPANHAAVAGACVTMLKAFFDESYVLPRPVLAGVDGQTLAPYSGPALTAGGELHKLASNLQMGRDFAGIHCRSDGVAGLLLGEAVAMGILRDQRGTFREDFRGFTFTKFDGTTTIV